MVIYDTEFMLNSIETIRQMVSHLPTWRLRVHTKVPLWLMFESFSRY